jgi:hypothetical protein
MKGFAQRKARARRRSAKQTGSGNRERSSRAATINGRRRPRADSAAFRTAARGLCATCPVGRSARLLLAPTPAPRGEKISAPMNDAENRHSVFQNLVDKPIT